MLGAPRHYDASALITAGLNIKTAQIRMRYASGKTTIDTYGHMSRTQKTRRGPQSVE